MTTPEGDSAFLHELELNVRSELTIVETGQPDVDANGVPTAEWLLDPDGQRYEVGLHSLLGAVETLEHGSRAGGDPDAERPSLGTRAARAPGTP
jgi:hypothetical protein